MRALRLDVDGTLSALDLAADEDGYVLDGLYRAIGCALVDCVRLAPGIDMWIDDEGLLIAEPQWNCAATVLVHAFDYRTTIAGHVVLTGGADEEGNCRGLSELAARKVRELLERVAR